MQIQPGKQDATSVIKNTVNSNKHFLIQFSAFLAFFMASFELSNSLSSHKDVFGGQRFAFETLLFLPWESRVTLACDFLFNYSMCFIFSLPCLAILLEMYKLKEDVPQ